MGATSWWSSRNLSNQHILRLSIMPLIATAGLAVADHPCYSLFFSIHIHEAYVLQMCIASLRMCCIFTLHWWTIVINLCMHVWHTVTQRSTSLPRGSSGIKSLLGRETSSRTWKWSWNRLSPKKNRTSRNATWWPTSLPKKKGNHAGTPGRLMPSVVDKSLTNPLIRLGMVVSYNDKWQWGNQ